MKDWIGRNKNDLDTPCLVIDQDILEENLERMQTFAQSSGKQVRPHAKTHKCSAIVRKQMEAGAIGVCTAKLSEARGLVDQGIRGILITGPVVAIQKIEGFLDCLEIDPSLMVVIDHPENARSLDEGLRARHLTANVLLDVDVGLGRTGVSPEAALELGRKIEGFSSLRLKGIQAYAGHVQHIESYEARHRASLECMERAADVFHRLREAGMGGHLFTGGGTGTYDIDVKIPDLTDLQVGSYVVMDAHYMGIGSVDDPEHFHAFRPSLTLLATVVSVNQKGFVTVDAGLKALYKDGAPPRVLALHESGMRYEWFGDEYGKILIPENLDAPKLGAVIELVVSHCDPTINQFDSFYVTRGDEVVDIWPIDLRGKCQ